MGVSLHISNSLNVFSNVFSFMEVKLVSPIPFLFLMTTTKESAQVIWGMYKDYFRIMENAIYSKFKLIIEISFHHIYLDLSVQSFWISAVVSMWIFDFTLVFHTILFKCLISFSKICHRRQATLCLLLADMNASQ